MQRTRTHKLVKASTTALAAALFAVPVAQARLAVDARHSALLNRQAVVQQPVVRTDARHAGLLNKAHVTPLIMQERRVSRNAQMHRHLANVNLPAADTSVGTVSTGFDWSDAGAGAGVVFGLVLLAGGGLLVTRRRLISA